MRDTSEVAGFSSLRWEDQERIRKKIDGAGDATDGPSPSGGKTKGGSKRKTTRSDLKVECAKSNRSTCKGCDSQIDKVSTLVNLPKLMSLKRRKNYSMARLKKWFLWLIQV